MPTGPINWPSTSYGSGTGTTYTSPNGNLWTWTGYAWEGEGYLPNIGGAGIDGSNSRRWDIGGDPTTSGTITLLDELGNPTTDPSLVGIIRVNILDNTSADLENWLDALNTSPGSFPRKAYIQITKSSDNNIFGIYNMGEGILLSNFYEFPVLYVAGSTPAYDFSGVDEITFSWISFGAQGNAGPAGPAGPDLYSLSEPKLRLGIPPGLTGSRYIDENTVVIDLLWDSIDGITGSTGSTAKLDNPPFVIPIDLSDEQIAEGVWVEMMVYQRARRGKGVNKKYKRGPGYVIPSPYYGLSGATTLLDDLNSLYGTTSINTRNGIHSSGVLAGGTAYTAFDRPNHYKVTDRFTPVPVWEYLNNLFSAFPVSYRFNPSNAGDTAEVSLAIPHWKRTDYDRVSQRYAYSSNLHNLYVKFRYIMFDPSMNGGSGGFKTGPSTEIACIALVKPPFKGYVPDPNTIFTYVTLNPQINNFNKHLSCRIQTLTKSP